MQPWPDAMLDALWLTAQQWDDGALETVLPQLPRRVQQALSDLRERRARQSRADKARSLSRIIDTLKPAVPLAAALPARALGILAGQVPRDTGRRWAGLSPAPRHGFQSDRALRQWLARMAHNGDAE